MSGNGEARDRRGRRAWRRRWRRRDEEKEEEYFRIERHLRLLDMQIGDREMNGKWDRPDKLRDWRMDERKGRNGWIHELMDE